MQKKMMPNYQGSLEDYKLSINADAQRKTKEGVILAMQDLVEGQAFLKSLPPDAKPAPEVLKRLEQDKKFVYENRMAVTNPSSVKVKKAKKK